MEHWKVLDKRQDKDPRGDGTILVLVCERAGKKREAVVSGFTWDKAVVGEHVILQPADTHRPPP